MKRPFVFLLIGILTVAVGALAFRLPRLALRPMHGDEANQAVKAGILLETGVYHYDPSEHHGPSLSYLSLPSLLSPRTFAEMDEDVLRIVHNLTQPSLWFHGARIFAETDEEMFRIVPVVFGVGVILLLLLVGDGLGRAAAVVAGVLLAISPAMVFYSRYYVQEMLLVFFTLAAIACGWRYVRTKSVAWAAMAGASIGLAHATKETWVLAAAAMTAGLVLEALWTRLRDGPQAPLRKLLRLWAIVGGVVAAVVVAALLYSSFGANLCGPLDSVLTFSSYLNKAFENKLHDHPWYYYLLMLVADRPARGFFWSEGLIVGLSLVGFVAALTRKGVPDEHKPLARFLAFYTLILTALYSAISYKTPWCMLSFFAGMILLAGVGAVALVRLLPGRPLKAIACVVLAAAAAQLGWQAYQLNYRFYADQRNPYVYAHPSADVLNLAARMEQLAKVAPEGYNMQVHVITPENYWPLPWYLRRFNQDHVGFWHDVDLWWGDVKGLPPPAVVIVSPEVEAAVEERLKGPYNRQSIYGLRPTVLLQVWVRESLWEKMLSGESKGGGAK
jgi:uncharacterized protein (TIGR03663 family)